MTAFVKMIELWSIHHQQFQGIVEKRLRQTFETTPYTLLVSETVERGYGNGQTR